MKNLSVWFPYDEIEYGDVPSGTATVYKWVPDGVYRYAGYRYELNGEIVTQPVVDFLGESALEGKLFTYTIVFDLSRDHFTRLNLVQVSIDE